MLWAQAWKPGSQHAGVGLKLIETSREFPGGPMTKTSGFTAKGMGSVPGRGTKISMRETPETYKHELKGVEDTLYLGK